MPTLAEIVHAYRAQYQPQHSLSLLERQTLEALLACRSGSLGPRPARSVLSVAAPCACWPFSCLPLASSIRPGSPTRVKPGRTQPKSAFPPARVSLRPWLNCVCSIDAAASLAAPLGVDWPCQRVFCLFKPCSDSVKTVRPLLTLDP